MKQAFSPQRGSRAPCHRGTAEEDPCIKGMSRRAGPAAAGRLEGDRPQAERRGAGLLDLDPDTGWKRATDEKGIPLPYGHLG
jgi:hypothetical protein